MYTDRKIRGEAMSFSEDIKYQICNIPAECRQCEKSQLAGIIEFAGRQTGSGVLVVTENFSTYSLFRRLLKNTFRIGIDTADIASGRYSYSFDAADCKDILSSLYLFMNAEEEKNKFVSPKECCRSAYLRGAFLGGGSILDPRRGYHLEFDTKEKNPAEYLCRLLAADNIPVKVTMRKNHYIVYTKSSEVIADILGKMKIYTAVMDFYNISAEKEIRNDINRRVNCETANLDKTAKAAVKHIEAIRKIEKTAGLGILSDILRQTAKMRIEYPEDSLAELSARLGVGKSGVNHRLTKIIEIAEEL